MISSSRPPESVVVAGPRIIRGVVVLAAIVLVGGLAIVQFLHERGTRHASVPTVSGPGRYRHSSGTFELSLPAGWTVREREVNGDSGEIAFVVFRAAEDLELWVRIRDLGHDRPERLAEELRLRAESTSPSLEPVVTNIGGRIAFLRRVGIYQHEILTVDVLVGTTNHHVQVAAPRGQLDRWEPVWRDILLSYDPCPVR